jgi:hypothetical protein
MASWQEDQEDKKAGGQNQPWQMMAAEKGETEKKKGQRWAESSPIRFPTQAVGVEVWCVYFSFICCFYLFNWYHPSTSFYQPVGWKILDEPVGWGDIDKPVGIELLDGGDYLTNGCD